MGYLFFQGRKPAVIWDAKNNRPEFEFINRFLTVDDPKKAERLKSLGYIEVPEGTKSVRLPERDGETPPMVEMVQAISAADGIKISREKSRRRRRFVD